MRIRFGPFTLDLDTRQVTRESSPAPAGVLHLTPKAFELLTILAVDRPKALSKATLQERLWPDTFVAEANLSNLIAEIREALDDRGRAPAWIRTAHGFGYAFCGEATTLTNARETAANRPLCWLEWGTQRFPLSIGEHVIGRDDDVEVKLDASTVSRRHAKLVVNANGTLLEDFGSKNGTRLGNEPVVAPVRLSDGDTIHIGSLLLTFRVRAVAMTTDTQAESS